jgi:hypothetical protein
MCGAKWLPTQCSYLRISKRFQTNPISLRSVVTTVCDLQTYFCTSLVYVSTYRPICIYIYSVTCVYYICLSTYSYFILFHTEILLLFYQTENSVASSCLPVRGTPSLADRRFSLPQNVITEDILLFLHYSCLDVLVFPKQGQHITTGTGRSFCSCTYRFIRNDCRGFNNLSYTIHLR